MAYSVYNERLARFKEGTRVRVKTRKKYVSEGVPSRLGTVCKISRSSLGVKLDDLYNSRSEYGCYWFTPYDLELVENDNENTKENNMTKITNYLNVAKIKFAKPDGTAYGTEHSIANFDAALQIDDVCVVDDFDGEMRLARVIDILPCNDLDVHHEVIARIDTAAYDARVATRKKAAELKAKMEERAKQLQDIALYQMLAKDDPDMAALVKEYQDISKV